MNAWREFLWTQKFFESWHGHFKEKMTRISPYYFRPEPRLPVVSYLWLVDQSYYEEQRTKIK